jgi:uncharacterized membrane protein
MATAPLGPSSLRNYSKPILWGLFALAFLSVLLLYDLPMFSPANPAHARMIANRPLLIPHILTAVTAFLLGPLQFSSRFRRRYLPLHRLLGKVYVCCALTAAPLGLIIARDAPGALFFAGIIQPVLWFVFTLAAYLAARNRQIAQHRRWMVRSYSVGCTIFVFARVTDPIPAFHNITPDQQGVHLLLYIILALAIPELAFGWHEIFTRRVTQI